MIGIELERGLALLFLAEAVETFDRRMTMGAIFPFAGRAPFELRGLGSIGKASRAAIKASTFTPLFALLPASAIVTLP